MRSSRSRSSTRRHRTTSREVFGAPGRAVRAEARTLLVISWSHEGRRAPSSCCDDPMTVKWMVGSAMFFPALGSAADLCRDSKTTRDMNQCLSDQITLAEKDLAEKDLARYLEESRSRVANDPRTLAEFERAQQAWVGFRDAHCGAIYQ